ncbi:MAG: tRNA 2-selenouridine(34) synthase MnmH [Bdellovibrionales bacterium RIFCSPHIGHO2_01_FULL_40_29]|nr:MAG: tRNA 2-selenouridine(34) synthase MnmH [Bdellovibrionales bacterium RIFCSPHIGHO2_01_FULL_40_29]OFZ32723.1 MAG: tRNA 2-selenouridine(34) synthase MnmH [Bdellovibrionales bacterium RIFCSPHIGHO2_02_FULL_40_15]
MKTVTLSEFKTHLIQGLPVIDVRAPVEFEQGSIPGSVNLPVLSDQERHEVGLCYKTQGQEAAIALGYRIVSGKNLEIKTQNWLSYIQSHPEALITCFRGGLRSQTSQKFIASHGVDVPRLEKGYKQARAFFLETIANYAEQASLVILTGNTGSAKTHVLNALAEDVPVVDLEGLAHHRGSAFGAWDIPQPVQADFENRLAVKLLSLQQPSLIMLEDESRMIGHRHIPEVFFTKMRASPVILMNESLEQRIDNIYIDYISSKLNQSSEPTAVSRVLESYRESIRKIKNKLGGLRAQELLSDMDLCEQQFFTSGGLEKNKIWIEKLLVWYYDPMYVGSLEKREPKIQFKGSRLEVMDYIKSLKIVTKA